MFLESDILQQMIIAGHSQAAAGHHGQAQAGHRVVRPQLPEGAEGHLLGLLPQRRQKGPAGGICQIFEYF